MNTPEAKKKTQAKATVQKTPGACPYKGMKIVVPGAIFDEPGTEFTAVIKGWNGKKTDSVIAKFDDGTQYWFPLGDVLNWLDKDAAAMPDTPISAAGGGSSGIAAGATPVSSSPAADGLRNRRAKAARQPAAASSKQADPGEIEAAATADEVFDMPLWQQQNEQQQDQRQETQQQSSSSELGGFPAAGVAAGIVLLLLVMLLAIRASKAPAHDLEDVIDLLTLSKDRHTG